MDKKRIMIGIATEAAVCTETVQSLYNMMIPEDVETELRIIHSYNIADGRNELVDMMLNEGFDYIFFVDSDVVLPKNALADLYGMHWYFATGTYPRKEIDTLTQINPYTTLYGHLEENKDCYCPYFMPFSELPAGRIVQVDCCGLGCTLIHKDLFTQIERPYFFFAHENCSEDGTRSPYCMGEDMYFCRKIVKAGLQMWAHGDVICGHVGKYIYQFPDRDEMNKKLNEQQ